MRFFISFMQGSLITVIIDLAIAVFIGVIVSALVFAWEQGKKISLKTNTSNPDVKVYKLKGALFFGSVQSFKDIFNFQDDPKEIVIDFKNFRVYDFSGIEAIQNIAERYAKQNKKLHLLNLSKECSQLLGNIENVIEVSIIKDLKWHIANDKFA